MDALRLLIVASPSEERSQLYRLVADIDGLPLNISKCDDLDQAHDMCALGEMDVVLVCRRLLVEDSVQACSRMVAGQEAPILIVMDQQVDEAGALRLVREGAQDCLPIERVTSASLEKVLMQALRRRRAEQEALTLKFDLERRVEQRVQELDHANLALRREVDERARVESGLQESEARYRALVENTGEGIGIVDADDRFIFANRAADALFGVPEGLEGHSLGEFITRDQWEQVATTAGSRKEGEATSYTLAIKRGDGVERTLLVTTSSRQDVTGATVGAFGIFRDITDELLHEQDLRRRIAFEDLLVRISSTFLLATEETVDALLVDALGQIGAFSGVDRAYLFRYSDGTSIMSNTHEWCAPGVQPEKENLQGLPTEIFPAWMDSLLHHRMVYIPCVAELSPEWEAERQILEPQGIQSLVVVPIATGNKPMGFIGFDSVRLARAWSSEDQLLLRFMADNIGLTIRNVEQQRATRLATEEAHTQASAAEAANRTKSLFLANMSHEIRTPMNAILGFTQILQRDPALSPFQATHLETIARSGVHLLRLIDDVLDMSKIEAGRLVLRPAPLHLGDFLDDLVTTFGGRAESKGLELSLEREAGLPAHVMADEGKLRQILVNLLGNAIKFTERGRVELRVSALSPEAQEGPIHLVFQISDTGAGIPLAEQDSLFTVFQQGSTGERTGGTGLGLAISAKLAGLMDGGIEVRSEPGQGSCFTCKVRIELSAEPLKSLVESVRILGLDPTGGPVRVLVVDDEVDNRVLLCELLQPMGFDVAEAKNGREALELFNKWSPHAVLMDMRMPVMDGYEATRLIRATDSGRKVFIMAVTASAFDDARKQVMATGVDAFLRKPFRQEELVGVLGRGLGLRYLVVDPQNPAALPASSLVVSEAPCIPLSARMDEETRVHMLEAVQAGDMQRMKELIRHWEPVDRDGADALLRMVERYDYEALEASLSASA